MIGDRQVLYTHAHSAVAERSVESALGAVIAPIAELLRTSDDNICQKIKTCQYFSGIANLRLVLKL